MKKSTLFGIALLLSVSITGCQNANRLDHAEAPTHTPHQSTDTLQETTSPNTYLPQIMIDDTIYYLSSKGNPIVEITESDYLGRVLSTVSLSQKPIENGQANFNVNIDSPYAIYEDGIVVLWNKAWSPFVTEEALLSE